MPWIQSASSRMEDEAFAAETWVDKVRGLESRGADHATLTLVGRVSP